jgi:hypothetical protein
MRKVQLILGVFLAGVLSVDLEGILRFPDRLAAFPDIEANYKQIYDKLSGATNDVWLKPDWDHDFSLKLVRGENYTGCIRGGFTRTYGTIRSYNDVMADYKTSFPGKDWTEDSGYTGISGKTIRIQLHFIEPSSPDYAVGSGKYRTIYTVSLIYADPAVEYCYG